ncbi:MAG: cyclic pyranopterin monophosphate synthase MoaC [Cyclobacteriaceae bacterium]|nr:cyclic pyranopterin monophosphate synthase MoaC [Cyclobacteriaceae bacterium]
MKSKLSHVDRSGTPRMVNVGGKKETQRSATACARVWLGPAIMKQLQGEEIRLAKGPVFQTAILAGIQGAKKTADLIPLCHPLSLEDCSVTVRSEGEYAIIEATANITAKTGVEMEALTAVSVAALTLYDMCKALSHDIRIESIHLLSKRGGKRDFVRKA